MMEDLGRTVRKLIVSTSKFSTPALRQELDKMLRLPMLSRLELRELRRLLAAGVNACDAEIAKRGDGAP